MGELTGQQNGNIDLTPAIGLDYVITQSLKFLSKKIEFGAKNMDFSPGCLADKQLFDGV